MYETRTFVPISQASRPVEILEPQLGWSEIHPDNLWNATVEAINEAIEGSGQNISRIRCMGFCTQRSSFVTWDDKTHKPLHNFITWKDNRSQQICDRWNSSMLLRLLKLAARGLSALTGDAPQWKTLVNFQFSPAHVSMRLLWALRNVDALKQAVCKRRARFGCVETWMLWKLTGGKVWAAEASCATTTGMYDVYSTLNWHKLLLFVLGIPLSILPPVYDSMFADFGETDKEIFGHSFPIKAILADQSASLLAECCFKAGSVKLTLGTCSCLNVVTGLQKPIAAVATSRYVVLPVMALKCAADAIFAAEVFLPEASNTGNIVDSLVTDGYITDISELDRVAKSVQDTAGVSFIPCPGPGGAHRIEGRTADTKAAHIVRAALLAIANVVKALGSQLEADEPQITVFGKQNKVGDLLPAIRINGGVSRCDFVCQAIANALQRNVVRNVDVEASCRGIAMLSSVSSDVRTSFPDLASNMLKIGTAMSHMHMFLPE